MFYSLIQRIVSTRSALSKQQNYYQVLAAIWEANMASFVLEFTAA